MTATVRQHPLGTRWNRRTTARQVLEGIDLHGKVAVVTGGHSGLGRETTRALAQAGARVIVCARNPAQGRLALANGGDGASGLDAEALSRVEVLPLDLADPLSAATLARQLVARGKPIDILVNNAGVMAAPLSRNERGWESQFGVNHLGHLVLSLGLWPLLRDAGARLVSVSSAGHHQSDIRWDDVMWTEGYDKWRAYGQSKTANALFALEMDARAAQWGVRAFSLHPGAILTPLQRHLDRSEMVELGWVDENGELADQSFKTPEQGAATAVWAATSDDLDDTGGVYCADCEVAEVWQPGADITTTVRTWAVDPRSASRLWELSDELVGDLVPTQLT